MDNTAGEDDVLIEMRMKYAEDLEEILECPVCLEIPSGTIAMCTEGHALCFTCKDLLVNIGEKCPTCQCSFSTCRNYTAEKLCAKFEDIKSSILDPRHASNRRIKLNKTSVHVQTEKIWPDTANSEFTSVQSEKSKCQMKGESLVKKLPSVTNGMSNISKIHDAEDD